MNKLYLVLRKNRIDLFLLKMIKKIIKNNKIKAYFKEIKKINDIFAFFLFLFKLILFIFILFIYFLVSIKFICTFILLFIYLQKTIKFLYMYKMLV